MATPAPSTPSVFTPYLGQSVVVFCAYRMYRGVLTSVNVAQGYLILASPVALASMSDQHSYTLLSALTITIGAVEAIAFYKGV